ncbi:glucosamine-6-phosphate deaminase [Propioniciclava sp. MC1595]|uniref:glucosamine-6-phosphate deaminase n=1 Tax=Propioniciclava sp. MC1595 TaxID=2760308 RepID=UPI00166241B4|nr:glucosamine-6-phosphate deaminase [Propioniciclava sp. MC1595]MBB1495033.1 glucosamine-6-phosphate deaminase [Propioniciclava sp. MC1595]QTE26265.1 glucosamine-6-phosphate deaminase [Propioniciclava sp. MC1595]
MEIIICPDGDEVARVAAETVAQVCWRVGPDVVLGVATGSSPLALYRDLAALVSAGKVDLSGASAFALDEYVGLPEGHPESYAEVIRRTVTEPLGLDPARVRVPDGRADDIEEACERYELAIRDAGGVDIQILGIGANGHIGFNEPSSSLSSRTRIKTLTPKTRADNARFFDSLDQVPVHCLTQGLGTILDAAEVVLVAQGASKADAVAAMVEGPVSASCPGSILQTHQYATIVVDEAAASKLANHEYYRWAYANKPAWQGFGQD